MRLIFVRHGETVENVTGYCQGQLPGRLSELGIQQAHLVAARLAIEKPCVIFSSDLARAYDTGKIIASKHSGVQLLARKELRERSWGDAQGIHKSQIEDIFGYPGVEQNDAFMARTKEFIHQLGEHKCVIVVGHGGSIHACVGHLLGKSFAQSCELGSLGNTSITIFDHDLKLYGCVGHLQ